MKKNPNFNHCYLVTNIFLECVFTVTVKPIFSCKTKAQIMNALSTVYYDVYSPIGYVLNIDSIISADRLYLRPLQPSV